MQEDKQDNSLNVAVVRDDKLIMSKWLQLPDEDLNDEGYLHMLAELFNEIKELTTGKK